MIRLAIAGETPAAWESVAPRLRGATIDSFLDEAPGQAPATTCQAVVVVGSLRSDKGSIEYLLHAGKHVLLAAGPCLPSVDLMTLWAAARQVGVQLSVVNPDRYLPSRQLIREQIGGNLGAAGLVRMHRWEPASERPLADSLGVPGALVHDLELALSFFGCLPERVYALEHHAKERALSALRFLQVHLGFRTGGMALIGYDQRLPSGDGYQSLSVIGSDGAAYADDHQNMQLVYRGGRPQAVRTEEGARQRAALVQDFIDALHAGRDLSASAAVWRGVFTVVNAVSQSLTSRRAIPLGGG
jgi:predicted dehydrogenase